MFINTSFQSVDINYDVRKLNGKNHKVWKVSILLHLGWTNIDYTIRKKEALKVTNESSIDAMALYENSLSR